jgi:hypothetical protein
MRKLKNFTLPSSCKPLNNEMMIEIVGGANDKTCSFNSSQSSCSGSCDLKGIKAPVPMELLDHSQGVIATSPNFSLLHHARMSMVQQ